jgi:endonuclease/exonuclease/phosphatase (EEP) superfamily protein YafD
VLGQNKRYADAVEWIRSTNPDFIYLPETDEKWGDGLTPLSETYPYGVDAYFEGNFGSSFRSKHPLVSQEIHQFGRMRIPLIQAVVATPDGEVTVFGAHPLPPATAFWAEERDTYLQGLVDLVSKSGGRVVILGDMNATRWSHTMSPFFARGFRDVADGHGFSATWMRGNPLMAVPIDLILTKGFRATIDRKTGPDIGSDHRPVTADLAW